MIYLGLSGAEGCLSCRSRKILQSVPTLAIVAVHTAENEPLKVVGVASRTATSWKGLDNAPQMCP